jgi:predicted acyl esterase
MPAFLKKNVAYYVAGPGAECWKYADSLASVPVKSMTLFLNAEGGAHAVYNSGILQGAAAGAVGGAWVSDPSDLTAAKDNFGQPGDELHGDGLVFHSPPFAEDAEIDGHASLKVSLVIDGPDADIGYSLSLVMPDGKSRALTASTIRARYRQSLEHGEAVVPGKVETYDLGQGQWFAVRAPKGSRLRLVLKSINEPGAQKNWNSIKPIADQTLADAHRETIQLVQTPDHPSTLMLPLGDPAAPCRASADW